MSGKSLAMMPWFPRDFIAATRHLALAERGAYRELLDHQWEMGSLPKDPVRLCRMLGVTPDEFAPIWASISDKFEESGAGLVNKRLEEHRIKAVAQRDRKIRGAEKTNAQRYGQRAAERDAKRLDIGSPPSPSPSPYKESTTAALPPTQRVPRETDPGWLLDFKLAYPDRAGDPGWRRAAKAGNARLAEGHTPAEFIEGAKRYAAFCAATGKIGTEYVKQAATFLGPDKPFLEAWTIPPPPKPQRPDPFRGAV